MDDFGLFDDQPPVKPPTQSATLSQLDSTKILIENLKNAQFKTQVFFAYINDVSKLSEQPNGPTLIVQAGGVPVLMNCLHQCKTDIASDSQIIQAIISLSTNICLDKQGPPTFRSLGVLSLMLEILHNQPNDDLTQRILYFMFNFSDEPLNQKLIRELGGISLFSRYLTKHLEIAKLNPQDDKLDTIMALCGLFWNLGYNDYNKIIIRDEGVTQKMFSILKTKAFRTHKKLICTALGTCAALYDPTFVDEAPKDLRAEILNTKDKELAKKYISEYNFIDWEIKYYVEMYFPDLLKILEAATTAKTWDLSEESFVGNTLELCALLCQKGMKEMMAAKKEYFKELRKRDQISARIMIELEKVVNALEQ